MEKKLVIIGGGGHGRSVIDTALRMGCFSEIVIVDPALPVGSKMLGCRVAGDDDLLGDLYQHGFKNAFIAIGSIKDTDCRHRLNDRIVEIGFEIPDIIDPSAEIAESCRFAAGAFVGKNVCINAGVVVGRNAIINTASVIEHDCRVGDYTHVSVGAILCGDVRVGSDCFLGAGSIIVQGVSIGDNRFIKAGRLVKDDE